MHSCTVMEKFKLKLCLTKVMEKKASLYLFTLSPPPQAVRPLCIKKLFEEGLNGILHAFRMLIDIISPDII